MIDRRQMISRLLEQGPDPRAFKRDSGAFRVVFIVGGDEVLRGDDVRVIRRERVDLFEYATPLSSQHVRNHKRW